MEHEKDNTQENQTIKIYSEITEKKGFIISLAKIFSAMRSLNKKKIETSIDNSKNLSSEHFINESIKNEKDELTVKANKYIKAKLYHLYFNMIKNGYQPNTQQKVHIINYLAELIKDGNLLLIDEHIEQGLTITKEGVVGILYTKQFQEIINKNKDFLNPEYKRYDILSLTHLSKHMREIMFEKDFPAFFFKCWFNNSNDFFRLIKNTIKNGSTTYKNQKIITESFSYHITKFLQTYETIIFKDPNFEQFLEFMGNWQENQDLMSKLIFVSLTESKFYLNEKENYQDVLTTLEIETKKLEFLVQKHFSEQINHINMKTKELYLEEHINNTLNETSKIFVSQFDLNELPETAKNLISDIKKLYSSLINKDTDIQTKTQLERLVTYHVPNIIIKYLRIEGNDRLELKNSQGQNSEDILNISLTNIKNKLDSMTTNLNQGHLHDLNAMMRYTNNI